MRASVSRSRAAAAVRQHDIFRFHFCPILTVLLVLIAGALSSGCAIKLGPDYDKAIFDGLTKSNEDAMTLFSSVTGGGSKATYPSRKPAYDAVIGELDALSVQIQARGAPSMPVLVGGLLPQPQSPFGVPDLFPASSCFATAGAPAPPAAANAPAEQALPVPTASAVRCLSFTMTTMRDADARNGIGATVAGLFKMRFAFFMTNALAYEKALNR